MSMHIKINSVNAKYALLPGDPGRCSAIADRLDNLQHLAFNREYNSYLGYIDDTGVVVCSTGIGGPSTAIAVEELAAAGIKSMLRIGTCGAMQPEIRGGDLIIAAAAYRHEGTSLHYAPIEYPAVANINVTNALIASAKEMDAVYHAGVVHSKDSFYGQHAPDSMPVANELKENWRTMIKLGVLASEMECAALFTVGAVRKIACGAVLTALWNQEAGEKINEDTSITSDIAIDCAVGALRKLIAEEKSK